MNMRGPLIFCLLVLAIDATNAAETSCETTTRVVSACFSVHGRITIYNGTPSVRIWPVGTNRLLGVLDGSGAAESDHIVPPELNALIVSRGDGSFTSVFGDFSVCPLTRQQPGRMQMVCIKGVTKLRASSN